MGTVIWRGGGTLLNVTQGFSMRPIHVCGCIIASRASASPARCRPPPSLRRRSSWGRERAAAAAPPLPRSTPTPTPTPKLRRALAAVARQYRPPKAESIAAPQGREVAPTRGRRRAQASRPRRWTNSRCAAYRPRATQPGPSAAACSACPAGSTYCCAVPKRCAQGRGKRDRKGGKACQSCGGHLERRAVVTW